MRSPSTNLSESMGWVDNILNIPVNQNTISHEPSRSTTLPTKTIHNSRKPQHKENSFLAGQFELELDDCTLLVEWTLIPRGEAIPHTSKYWARAS